MSTNTSNTSARSASRWWRLDPRVAAHVRAVATPARSEEESGPAATLVKRWSAEPDAWADTDWADTQVNFFLD